MSRMRPSTAYAFCLAVIVLAGTVVESAAKAPGNTHCYGGICHRILTVAETAARVGIPTRMYTSYYDSCERDPFNPCGLTSSGEEFRPWKADNAASSVYPDGTILLVYNPGNRTAAVVRVNSLGPFKGNRLLDVSRATAEKLGFTGAGVARLHVTVLKAPTKQETGYRQYRTYSPVPGYIGRIKTLDDALAFAASKVGTGLPPLKPIIAQSAADKPARLLPELPMTSTLARYAAGAISLFVPMAMAAEPKVAQAKATPQAKTTKAAPGKLKLGKTANPDPDAAVTGLPAIDNATVQSDAKRKMTPALAKSLELRQQRMGLGAATQAKCKAAARDKSRCPDL